MTLKEYEELVMQKKKASEEFDIVESAPPFDINIQDHEQFPRLNVVIKT